MSAAAASSSASSTSLSTTHPFLTVGIGCILCSQCQMIGPHPITLGPGTILHPRAVLNSSNGPITLGANNILEENSIISPTERGGCIIGDMNRFRIGSQVESTFIGTGNVIECKAYIPSQVTVANGCVISTRVSLAESIKTDCTIVYRAGEQLKTRVKQDQYELNVNDIKNKEGIREILTKAHRLLH